jgi:AraC family transcriptional regulator, transcriptional activator of pobA
MEHAANTRPEIIVLESTGDKRLPDAAEDHYFTHLLCRSGTARFRLENQSYEIGINDIGIWPPSMGIKDLQYSRDFSASYLFVSFDLMSKNNPDISWGIKGFLFAKENPVIQLSEMHVEKCLRHFQLLREKYEDDGHRFHNEIVGLQLQIFIMEMWNIFSQEMEKRSVTNQQGALFERFLQLVQEHCMEERTVEFYAGKLFITPKYLTEICKKNSGKTALEWIHNYTTHRLMILLQNTSLSLTQVADALNFSSHSFFSRYVRKVLGVSPTEYRDRMLTK